MLEDMCEKLLFGRTRYAVQSKGRLVCSINDKECRYSMMVKEGEKETYLCLKQKIYWAAMEKKYKC